jgi:Skp family chaperone for outer membrane proteins
MKKIISTLVLLSAVATANATVQIATVDFNRAIAKSPQLAQMKASMKANFSGRKQQLTKMNQKIQSEIKSFRRDQPTMQAQVAQKKSQLIKRNVTDFEAKKAAYERDFLSQRAMKINAVVKSFKAAVAAVATQKKISVVLNQSAMVFNNHGAIDITQDVARVMAAH